MRTVALALLLLITVSMNGCTGAGKVPVVFPPPPPIPGVDIPKPTCIPDAPEGVGQPNQPGPFDIPRNIPLSINHEVKGKERFPEKVGDIPEDIPAVKAKHLPPNAPIKSWSLFLMPDYDALYRRPELVRQLKKAWEDLGGAIDGVNVSLWLDTGAAGKKDHPESNYNYKRAQEIIRQLDMGSATGPYIVITLTSPNLKGWSPVFTARLTGINKECYPQIVDSLARYIKEKKYSSWKLANDVWEHSKIEILRDATCKDASVETAKTGE